MEWIDVEEKVPRVVGDYARRSTTVLVFDSKTEAVHMGFYTHSNNKSLIQSGWRFEGIAGIWRKSVTHWMPLPSPPEEVKP